MKKKVNSKGMNKGNKNETQQNENSKIKTKRSLSNSNAVKKQKLSPIHKPNISKSNCKKKKGNNDKNKENRNVNNDDDYNMDNDNNIHTIYSSLEEIRNNYNEIKQKLFSSKHFKINPFSFQIRSLNSYASSLLKTPSFWVLYIEFLFNTHKLNSSSLLINIINSAFRHITSNHDLTQIKQCYLTYIHYLYSLEHNNKHINNDSNFYMDLLDKVSTLCMTEPSLSKKINIKEKSTNDNEQRSNGSPFSFSFEKQLRNKEDPQEEENDKVDEFVFQSINKLKSNENTPLKIKHNLLGCYSGSDGNKSDILGRKISVSKEKFSSEEKFPIDIVEGSIQKFNRSFTSDNMYSNNSKYDNTNKKNDQILRSKVKLISKKIKY